MPIRPTMLKYVSIITIIYTLIMLYITITEAINNPLFIIISLLLVIPSLFIIITSFIKIVGIKKWSKKTHDERISLYNANNNYPTIDVFLPIAGEDIGLVDKTWKAAKNLIYDNNKLNVYVLDDKKELEKKALAGSYGFNYITRDNNSFKKAGNLRNAFEQTNGDFILILDADFCPEPEFLFETLAYFEDPKVGIVQTPQAFKYEDKIGLEQGAGNIQDFFYSIVQPARDTFGAAICVGTNALYRRSALKEIGGNVLIEHSEDVWTGFTLLSKGYKLKYLPINLAYGVCPSDPYSYFKQQTRWCQGSSSLISSKFFWETNLTFMQRISYLSGFLFYLYSFNLLLFPLISLLLLVGRQYIQLTDIQSLLIGSYILVSTIVTIFFIYAKSNINTTIAHVLATWSYAYALFNLFILRRNEEWQPTGGVKVKKSDGFNNMINCMYLYTVSLAILTGFVAVIMPNIFLIYLIINLFVHIVTSIYVLRNRHTQ
jgi:cellulose synthase/poly-beta-1,6-N-acetylglucosamine synthase-like glycosyltransferase